MTYKTCGRLETQANESFISFETIDVTTTRHISKHGIKTNLFIL